jgi:hypothetical protein
MFLKGLALQRQPIPLNAVASKRSAAVRLTLHRPSFPAPLFRYTMNAEYQAPRHFTLFVFPICSIWSVLPQMFPTRNPGLGLCGNEA